MSDKQGYLNADVFRLCDETARLCSLSLRAAGLLQVSSRHSEKMVSGAGAFR